LRAGAPAIANIRLEREKGHCAFVCSSDGVSEGDMGLYAVVSRRRLGQMLGGERGRELIAETDEWMAKEGIKNPRG